MTVVSIKVEQKYILAEEIDKRDNSSSTSSLSQLERELAPENEVPGNHLMFLLSMNGLSKWNSLLQSQLPTTSLKQISEFTAISIVLYKTSSLQEIHYQDTSEDLIISVIFTSLLMYLTKHKN